MRWTRLPLGLAVALVLSVRMAAAGPIEDAFHRNTPGSTLEIDHSAWSALLAAYVKPSPDGLNRVDYAAFKQSGRAALRSYLERLLTVDPTRLDKPEQMAFWANLYNAKTIDVVLEAYPVASIKDIRLGGSLLASGPWSRKLVKVNGIELSLDDIEHVILRPYFKDPRVHYAVNCASVGCPNLATSAFSGRSLEAQLEAGARAFVNSPRGFALAGGKLTASKIYSWFQKDFGGSEAGVLAHARGYAEGDLGKALAARTRIDSFDYDWSLNDTGRDTGRGKRADLREGARP